MTVTVHWHHPDGLEREEVITSMIFMAKTTGIVVDWDHDTSFSALWVRAHPGPVWDWICTVLDTYNPGTREAA